MTNSRILMLSPGGLFLILFVLNSVNSFPLPENDTNERVNQNNNKIRNGSLSEMEKIVRETIKNDKLFIENEKPIIEKIANLTSQHFENVSISNVNVNKNKTETESSSNFRDGRAISMINQGTKSTFTDAKTSNPTTTISIDDFFKTFRFSFLQLLQQSQLIGLRLIGLLDRGLTAQEERVQKAAFNFVLEGQKRAAKIYHRTPKFVNTLIQKFGTVRDTNFYPRLNEVVNQGRENRKKFYDFWENHERDFHNVFNNNVWPAVNRHLRVPELPRMAELGWY